MEKNRSGWSTKSLPSHDVVEDSDYVDSRVPSLGLHLPENHPWEKQNQDQRCDSGGYDSGVCMSGASSVRSSYASSFRSSYTGSHRSSLADLEESHLRDQVQKLSIGQKISESSHQTAERIPSVDEGFYSTEDSTRASWNSDVRPIVFPPAISKTTDPAEPQTEEKYIDNEDQILEIFVQDEDGDTKLHMAIIQLVPDVAEQMIDLSPEPWLLGIQNSLGQTPLHLAVITKQTDVVRKLVVMGAPLEQRDRHGNTALHLACREGDLACVQALTLPLTTTEVSKVSYSVSPQRIPQNMDIWNYDGETCLHLALLRGHRNIITYLISPRVMANVNNKDGRSGRTILHYAVESGDIDLVRFIIHNCQANVNSTTFDGSTPLKLAVGRGFPAAANLLVASGADQSVLISSEDSDYSESDDEMYDDIQLSSGAMST